MLLVVRKSYLVKESFESYSDERGFKLSLELSLRHCLSIRYGGNHLKDVEKTRQLGSRVFAVLTHFSVRSTSRVPCSLAKREF